MGIVLSILAFSFLIIVHEFGHLLTAKYFGVTVERFSLGLGKPIFKKHWKGTDYCLAPIPFGGYVKMKGEAASLLEGENVKRTPEEEAELEELKTAPDSYTNKPFWQKGIILSSGSIMNLISAFFIIWVLSIFFIEVPLPDAIVGSVFPGSPAATVGIEPGDRFVAFVDNGREYEIKEFVDIIKAKNEGHTRFIIERGSETFEVTLVPADIEDEYTGETSSLLGIEISTRKPNFGESFKLATFLYGSGVKMIDEGISMFFSSNSEIPKTEMVSGPIGIVNMTSKIADNAGTSIQNQKVDQANNYVRDFFYIWALISINLGLLNLFPLPPLDGGLIVLEAFKAPITKYGFLKTAVRVVSYTGIILLMGIMVMATFNDLRNIF